MISDNGDLTINEVLRATQKEIREDKEGIAYRSLKKIVVALAALIRASPSLIGRILTLDKYYAGTIKEMKLSDGVLRFRIQDGIGDYRVKTSLREIEAFDLRFSQGKLFSERKFLKEVLKDEKDEGEKNEKPLRFL